MAEIKVGQKYMLVNGSVEAGHVAEITSVTEDYVYYRPGLYFPDGDWKNLSFLSNWELLEEEDSEPLAVSEDNQLSPSVYQFPNGVEVRHISAHLTSFGGQAVQYIARATRLDGVVKGLPVQDIRKAIEILGWEADRMEALEKQK